MIAARVRRRRPRYPDMPTVPGTTLQEARDWLRGQVTDGPGAHCPTCHQVAREYRRRLNSNMAYALIRLYRLGGLEWVHKPTVLRGVGSAARDESLLRFWGLLEEAGDERPDGGRSGWWRVTPLGAAFVRREHTVREYAIVYDNRLLRLEGKAIDIERALGARFSYRELMGHAL